MQQYLKNLNLSKDAEGNELNTRANRRAKTFLDVNKMFCEENGTKRPLTADEQKQTIIKIFHDFLDQHFNVVESYGPFYGFRIEDLNQSVFNNIADYSKVFFEETKNLISSGEKKITASKEFDLEHIEKLANIFNKELLYLERNFRRLMSKYAKKYPGIVARIAEMNSNYQQKLEEQEPRLNVG